MHVYLMFVKDPAGKPHVGVLLGEDCKDALAKAVRHCKASFGPESRVTLIDEVCNADIKTLVRTKCADLMCTTDQLLFQFRALDASYTESLEMIDQLSGFIAKLRERIEALKNKETDP